MELVYTFKHCNLAALSAMAFILASLGRQEFSQLFDHCIFHQTSKLASVGLVLVITAAAASLPK
jgi:hypothetical protein